MKSIKDREKIAIICAVVLLAIFLFHQFVFSRMKDRLALLVRVIPQKEIELKEIFDLKAEYEYLKKSNLKKGKETNTDQGVVTLSYLEGLADKAGLKSNIKYMKPLGESKSGRYLQNSIDIELANVPLGKLVNFLYEIENSPRALKIVELNITTNRRDSSILDIAIQITSFETV
ncbi:MAG: hypothetical protein SWO11_11715 [Thermodesulfobacteriota bacterium]|nr:hypothetical protein [Thermodesulfobacteriota bacterium]